MNRILAIFRNKNAALYACMAVFLLIVAVITMQIPDAAAVKTVDPPRAEDKSLQSGNAAVRNLVRDSQVTRPETLRDVTVPPPVSTRLERSRVVEAKYQNLSEDLGAIDVSFKDYCSSYESIQSSLQALMTDEAGSRVGQSTELIASFQSLKKSVETLGDSIQELNRNLQLCRLEIEENLERNPHTDPPTEIAKSIASLRGSLRSIDEQLEARRLGLAFIVNEAAAFSVSDKKLSEAIKSKKSEQEIAFLAAKSEQAKIENSRRIAEARELEEKKNEAAFAVEQQKVADEIARLIAEKEAAAVKAKFQQEREVLEAEFERDLPRIKHYLGPLFVRSTKQPGGGANRETKDSMPVSLAALRAHGFSNTDVEKACQSLLLYFSYFKAGGRGQGPYPSYYAGGHLQDSEMAAIRPAYDLLDKYAELLVDKKMLAP
jgi:hypothetical protein